VTVFKWVATGKKANHFKLISSYFGALAGTRTRVASMGGLYDTITLLVPCQLAKNGYHYYYILIESFPRSGFASNFTFF
jgi:hypothetical protein